jgi:hypothetical protein
VEALQRQLRRDLRAVGDERRVLDADHGQLVVEALGVGEVQALALAPRGDVIGGQPRLPEVERVGRGDSPDDPVDHPRTGPAGRRARVLEEGEVGARVTVLVGEEQVVDGRVVLVDRFLDQPQPQHAGVEIDVALGVLGDRGDVVNSV